MKLYSDKIERLISTALSDGVLTDKEKQVLFKKAQEEGIDLDEFEMVLDARLSDLQKHEKDTNSSSKALANLLSKSRGTDRKEEIIESFPVPNTKDDLLDFIIALKPKMMDTSDSLSHSYFKKYEECISKAKLLFPGDDVLNPFVSEFPELRTQWKKQMNAYKREKQKEGNLSIIQWLVLFGLEFPVLGVLMIAFVIAAFIFICVGLNRLSDSVSDSLEDFRQRGVVKEQYEEIHTAYNNKDYHLAAHLLKDVPRHSSGKRVAKVLKNNYPLEEKLFYALLENGDYNDAKEIAYRNNSSKMNMSLLKTLVDNRKYYDAAAMADSDSKGDILRYCIDTENFPAGRTIIGENQYELFHDYISKYVINLCHNNKLAEASNIVENNISYFNSLKLKEGIRSGNKSEYERHNTEVVRSELQNIINSFKQ